MCCGGSGVPPPFLRDIMKKILISLALILLPLTAFAAGENIVKASTDTVTGSFDTANSASAVTVATSGQSIVSVYLAASAATGSIKPQISIDGTTWMDSVFYAVPSRVGAGTAGGSNVAISASSGPDIKYILPGAAKYARVARNGAGTGTVAITLTASGAPFELTAPVGLYTSQAADYAAVGTYGSILLDTAGRLLINPWGEDPSRWWRYVSASAVTDTTVTQMVAADANQYHYVTSMCCSNTSATATVLEVENGSAALLWNFYLGANSGFCHTFSNPPKVGKNSSLNFQAVTTGTSTRCSASGFSNVK